MGWILKLGPDSGGRRDNRCYLELVKNAKQTHLSSLNRIEVQLMHGERQLCGTLEYLNTKEQSVLLNDLLHFRNHQNMTLLKLHLTKLLPAKIHAHFIV